MGDRLHPWTDRVPAPVATRLDQPPAGRSSNHFRYVVDIARPTQIDPPRMRECPRDVWASHGISAVDPGYEPRDSSPRRWTLRLRRPPSCHEPGDDGREATDSRFRPSGYELDAAVRASVVKSVEPLVRVASRDSVSRPIPVDQACFGTVRLTQV